MKLGKVEFCHFLQLIALFLCFSGMSQAELSRSGSKPYFQSGRSRTKRSWVWNQFFVLEEYMGSDPLYVGKVGYLAFPSHKRFLCMSVVEWRTAPFSLEMRNTKLSWGFWHWLATLAQSSRCYSSREATVQGVMLYSKIQARLVLTPRLAWWWHVSKAVVSKMRAGMLTQQQSPTFLVLGTSFVEDSFSSRQRWGTWFGDDSRALHLLSALFLI